MSISKADQTVLLYLALLLSIGNVWWMFGLHKRSDRGLKRQGWLATRLAGVRQL
jgi:hypothetical protein